MTCAESRAIWNLLHGGSDDDIIRPLPAQQADSPVSMRVKGVLPFHLGHDPIPGHSRLVVNDGDPPSGDPVEKADGPTLGLPTMATTPCTP